MGVGQSEDWLMTRKVITVEFIVPTVIASVLGIALAICAIYLADSYLRPLDQTGDQEIGRAHV